MDGLVAEAFEDGEGRHVLKVGAAHALDQGVQKEFRCASNFGSQGASSVRAKFPFSCFFIAPCPKQELRWRREHSG